MFDIAFIDDKGFSERITTAPVSPLGQRFYVKTQYATTSRRRPRSRPTRRATSRTENQERGRACDVRYLYVTDQYEGLIVVGAGTLLDGNPLNNFLKRDADVQSRRHAERRPHITIVGTLRLYLLRCRPGGRFAGRSASSPRVSFGRWPG